MRRNHKFLFDLDAVLDDEALVETWILANCVTKHHIVIFVSNRYESLRPSIEKKIRKHFSGPMELRLRPEGTEEIVWKGEILKSLEDKTSIVLVNALNLSKHQQIVDTSKSKE